MFSHTSYSQNEFREKLNLVLMMFLALMLKVLCIAQTVNFERPSE
jgi:hypothetical protein